MTEESDRQARVAKALETLRGSSEDHGPDLSAEVLLKGRRSNEPEALQPYDGRGKTGGSPFGRHPGRSPRSFRF